MDLTRAGAALLLGAATALHPCEAQIAPTSRGGAVVVAPYVWMTGLAGETGVRDFSADFDVPFSDLLSHLRFAAMVAVEGGYGAWVGGVDLLYTSVEVDDVRSIGPLRAELEMSQKTLISNLFAGYSFSPDSAWAVDLLAGARIWMVDATLEVSGENLGAERSRDPKWVDAMGGVRVRWQAAEDWHFSLMGDGGAGGSDSTFGALATAAYRLSNRWALFAAYRYIDLDYRKNDYFFDGHLSGPVLGAVYHW
jgi:hypothetical protein